MKMNAVVLEKHQHLVYKQVPIPALKPGEVRIAVKHCGVCGTDLHIVYDGSLRYPHIPGHEITGVVVEAADEEGDGLIGKEVTAYGIIGCGHCIHCQNKDYSKCQSYTFVGAARDGGFAEYVNYPARNVIPLAGLSLRSGALIEPTAVTVHAIRLLREIPKSSVVIGTGPIGLLAAQALRAMGTQDTVVVGFSDRKAELVRSLGFGFVNCTKESVAERLAARGYADGVPAVLECSGQVTGLNCALNAASPGSEVVMVGIFESDVLLDAKACHGILRKELRVFGSWISSHSAGQNDSDWCVAMDLIRCGKIDTEQMITSEIELQDVPAALEQLHSARGADIKTLIHV